MPRVLDENGEVVLDPRYPLDVQQDDESFRRWEMCVEVAAAITRQPIDSPETGMFARVMYDDPDLPTDDPEAEVAEAYEEPLHPRGRGGEWIRKHVIRVRGLGRGPASPGIRSMRDSIRELGLDKDPTPGPVARRILGAYPDTQQMYLTHRPAGPLDSPAHPPYAKRRRARHDKIIGRALAGLPEKPGDPDTGVAALLGEDDGIVRKLLKGGRLSQAEKQRVRDAADRARHGGQPEAIFMAGGTASGKSTLLQNNPDMLPRASLRIDPDMLKEQLPEYQKMVAARDRYAAFAVHEESSDLAARLDQEATDLRLDLVVDGTGDSKEDRFREKLERQRDHGYSVGVMYVNSPTQDAIEQSVQRALAKGRWVPISRIRQIHAQVSRNYNHQISHLSWLKRLDVFDSQVGHIATMIDGKMEDIDPGRMDSFRAKEHETSE